MSNYKDEAKKSRADRLKTYGGKSHSRGDIFNDTEPYDGVPQLSTTVPAGEKQPIGKQRFQRGGKVMEMSQDKSKANLGKAPRKKAAGGPAKPLPHPGQRREPVPLPPEMPMDMRYERANPQGVGNLNSPYKKGGRIHKLSGGALEEYLKRSREDFDSQRKFRDRQRLANMMSLAYNKSSRPYSPRDIMDTESRMGRRAKGIRMAAKKLVGDANVPATDDEDKTFARGGMPTGMASVSGDRRKKMAAAIAYKKRNQMGKPMGGIGGPAQMGQATMPTMGKKQGGKVSHAEWEHSKEDLKQDKKLAKKRGMSLEKWEKSEADKKHDKQQSTKGLCWGGRARKLSGGALGEYIDKSSKNRAEMQNYKDTNDVHRSFAPVLNRKIGNRTKGMALAAAKMRGDADVGSRVPSPDNPNQRKKMAMQSLTTSELKKGGRIQRARGGPVKGKGKTTVNIMISPQQGGPQPPLGAGVGMGAPPVAPQLPMMPPAMPPGMAPGIMPPGMGAAGAGPGLGALAALAGGRPGMSAPVPPMRKSGGRVKNWMPKHQETEFGSGSGLGRLAKKKWPIPDGTA